jgi:hypothetical protein
MLKLLSIGALGLSLLVPLSARANVQTCGTFMLSNSMDEVQNQLQLSQEQMRLLDTLRAGVGRRNSDLENDFNREVAEQDGDDVNALYQVRATEYTNAPAKAVAILNGWQRSRCDGGPAPASVPAPLAAPAPVPPPVVDIVPAPMPVGFVGPAWRHRVPRPGPAPFAPAPVDVRRREGPRPFQPAAPPVAGHFGPVGPRGPVDMGRHEPQAGHFGPVGPRGPVDMGRHEPQAGHFGPVGPRGPVDMGRHEPQRGPAPTSPPAPAPGPRQAPPSQPPLR